MPIDLEKYPKEDDEIKKNRIKVLIGEWDHAKFERFMKYRKTQNTTSKVLNAD